MDKRTSKKTEKKPSNGSNKVVIKTQFQPNRQPALGEFNNDPSETVPDQALSLHQLLHNHTRGIPTNTKMYDPQYYGVEIPRIDDLTDLDKFRDELKENMRELESQINLEVEDHVRKLEEEQKRNSKTTSETIEGLTPQKEKDSK